MGLLESIATIAGSIGSIIGLIAYFQHKSKQKAIDERGRNEAELAVMIQSASDDEQRRKYAKMLHDLRNPK